MGWLCFFFIIKVVQTAGNTAKLNTLDVKKNSVNLLIGLASVDNRPLTESKRIVLVLSTRVANTNMQHDPSGIGLRVFSTLPILYQCVEYEIQINRAEKLRCYALSLTGERKEKVPLVHSDDGSIFSLNMAKLKHGPAVL